MFTRTMGMVTCGMPGRCLAQKGTPTGRHWLFRTRRPTVASIAHELHRRWAHHVTEVVKQVARTFPKNFATSRRHDVEQHVWLRISEGKYRPPAAEEDLAPFMAWCRRVATNKLRSQYNKWIRSTGRGQELHTNHILDERPKKSMLDILDELRRVCVDIREELDRMLSGYGPFDVTRHRQRGQVDYYAVLLMRVRLEIARLLAPYFQTQDVLEKDEVPKTIGDLMPWSRIEQRRAFRQGMPTLKDIWQSLAPRLNTEHWLDGRHFWEHFTALPGAGVNIDQKNQWDNWHRRVCRHLIAWISESDPKGSALSDEQVHEHWKQKWGALFDFPRRTK